MGITVSSPNNISSPRGNSLALYKDAETDDFFVKDIYGKTENFGKTLQGTLYVFVKANGTDIENAIELQSAYDLAITKVVTTQVLSAPYDFPSQISPTTLEFYDFNGTLPILIQGQSYTFNIEGIDMVGLILPPEFGIIVQFPAFSYNGGDVKVYTTGYLGATVIAANGNYNFENGNFVMNADYVSLVSLDGNKSIVFNGANTIEITANNIFVKGVDVQDKEFKIGDDLSKLNAESCAGGVNSFGEGLTVSGTFTNCQGGDYSFGGNGTVSGVFTNCQGGAYSFGGGEGGIVSGIFNGCVGDSNASFGGGTPNNFGTVSGTFTNCRGGFGNNTIASGTFTNCVGKFGGFGTASGVFTNCQGEFAGTGGTASGTFNNCQGGNTSFGGFGGTASGTFTNCTGGLFSFGSPNPNSGGGILSGKLYYCRRTGNTFQTVSGGGRTVLCIDGNNNQNNQ